MNFDEMSDEMLLEMLEVDKAEINEELCYRGYEYGWHKPERYAGSIYVLVNPAFPNLVKIGYADDVKKRVKSLNRNSGLPDPYYVYAIYRVKKRLGDLQLHRLIDSLDSSLRHSQNREFYEMLPDKAYGILSAIAQINGDDENLVKNPLGDDLAVSLQNIDSGDIVKKLTKKPRLTFSLIGVAVGEKVQFVEDERIEAVVSGDNTVSFENSEWTLSGLTRELKKRNGSANSSGAYQGGLYWKYCGEVLTDIRERTEQKDSKDCEEVCNE